jgi:hypothetical protein
VLEMGGGNQDSKVWLGDMQVLGNHFIKNDGENFLLPLEAGFYPIRIEFLKKNGGAEIVPIYIKSEGVEDFPLDLETLYFDR